MIVTLDELKTHLRIQHDEEDEYLLGLIRQAQTAAEDYCRVGFDPVDEEGNPIDNAAPEPVRQRPVVRQLAEDPDQLRRKDKGFLAPRL